MEATVFNNAQLHLLHMMSYIKTDEELCELKNVLSDYLAKKIDSETDMLCQQGVITSETIEAWEHEHMRTAYK
jgi:hypothetical protein